MFTEGRCEEIVFFTFRLKRRIANRKNKDTPTIGNSANAMNATITMTIASKGELRISSDNCKYPVARAVDNPITRMDRTISIWDSAFIFYLDTFFLLFLSFSPKNEYAIFIL
jgi:hypothetical protein